ncbi:DUF6000 family protein [Lentzea alba]|uniref:DUF6000 family protein n=1 Tax=Lentzea alba TaxID=2714351 RepID=UPI0039BF5228
MYAGLLHANLLYRMPEPERRKFVAEVMDTAGASTDGEIETLLRSGWREKIVGAYLAGFSHRTQFRDRIGELLVESATCFAGQGYCFALAAFGEADDAEWLATYLDRWLPELNCQYDQPWAMGALLHIDAQRATTYTDAWLNWINNGCWGTGYPNLNAEHETIKRLLAL